MLVLLVLFVINTTLANVSFGFNLDTSESESSLSIGITDSKSDVPFGFDLNNDSKSDSEFDIGLVDSKTTITQSQKINKGLNVGLTVGLTVGMTLLVAIICIILIIVFAIRHKKHDDENYPHEFELSNDDYSIQIDSYTTISE